jgi:hypothetical protein
MTYMKKILFAAAVVVAFATPSHASYTQCTVTRDIDKVSRPSRDGDTPPRWHKLQKGDKVAIREVFSGWTFVQQWAEQAREEQYGWVPSNVLVNCRAMEGTP